MIRPLTAGLALFAFASAVVADEVDLRPLVTAIREVAAEAKGNKAATEAWGKLAQAGPERIPEIIAALDGAGPLAENYLRAAVDAICQRTMQAGGKLPADRLEALATNVRHSPRARRLAYEWLLAADKTAEQRLALAFLADPALELRRDSVARLLAQAETISAKPTALKMYGEALAAARDFDQIHAAAKGLKNLGEEPDLPRVFGFTTKWRIIGPFDNTGRKGFDAEYTPEKVINFEHSYPGKVGRVKWVEYEAKFDPAKIDLAKRPHEAFEYVACVDLNAATQKLKEVVAYAVAEIESPEARDVEIRLDCVNANKVWLNGELVMSNHVYHAFRAVDQYVAPAKLKKGKNTILVKVAQNEQTQSWTVIWQFQLRVTDPIGTPLSAIKTETNH